MRSWKAWLPWPGRQRQPIPHDRPYLLACTRVPLLPTKVVCIAGGRDGDEGFSRAVSDIGRVYSWAANACFQLGHRHNVDVFQPTLVESLVDGDAISVCEGVVIRHVARGTHHGLVLSSVGDVFSFGTANIELKHKGVLGHGRDVTERNVARSLQNNLFSALIWQGNPIVSVASNGQACFGLCGNNLSIRLGD